MDLHSDRLVVVQLRIQLVVVAVLLRRTVVVDDEDSILLVVVDDHWLVPEVAVVELDTGFVEVDGIVVVPDTDAFVVAFVAVEEVVDKNSHPAEKEEAAVVTVVHTEDLH